MMNRSILVNDIKKLVSNNLDFWERLNGTKIFITGGTGFFGKWFLETFILLNNEFNIHIDITILTRNSKKFLRLNPQFNKFNFFHFLQGDIREFKFIEEKFDYLIHASATNAKDTFNNHDPIDKFESSAFGAKRILNFAIKSNVKKMIYLSSGSVYGNSNIETISENCFAAPNTLDSIGSALPEGKRVGEFYCSHYANNYHDINITIARCFSFTGGYLPLDIHYAIGNFIMNSLENNKITISGDGTPVRSYMYMSDTVFWIFKILLDGKNNNAYNVGSDEKITILELAKLIESISNKKIKIEIKNKLNKKTSAADCYVPNILKVKNELNLYTTVSLKDALQKTINFYRLNSI